MDMKELRSRMAYIAPAVALDRFIEEAIMYKAYLQSELGKKAALVECGIIWNH